MTSTHSAIATSGLSELCFGLKLEQNRVCQIKKGDFRNNEELMRN